MDQQVLLQQSQVLKAIQRRQKRIVMNSQALLHPGQILKAADTGQKRVVTDGEPAGEMCQLFQPVKVGDPQIGQGHIIGLFQLQKLIETGQERTAADLQVMDRISGRAY